MLLTLSVRNPPMFVLYQAKGICIPKVFHTKNKKSRTNYATFGALITLIWLDYHCTNH